MDDDKWTCTGNLSIEEDYLTRFKLVFDPGGDAHKMKMKWIRT